MWQAYEGGSTELNKLDVILQLVLWIFSYFVKYEWSENSKALLNIPIKTIILFSKVASYWCSMTRLITENTFLFFHCMEQWLENNLVFNSEIQWQSPSPFSDSCFGQGLLLWVANTIKNKTGKLVKLLMHTGKSLYIDLVGDPDHVFAWYPTS